MKKKNMMLPLSLCLCVLSICVMIMALAYPVSEKTFVPPEFDQNAQQGIPQVPDGLGWSAFEGDDLQIKVCGIFNAEGNSSDIWLFNDADNEAWIKVRMIEDDEKVLGETGLIRPGEYVQSIKYDQLPGQDTNIVLKVMAYEPETYHSAGSFFIEMKRKE